jgi:EmrB/QacA subfamily drug resistance transporter
MGPKKSTRGRLTLTVVSAATALLLLDVTVVNVALPAIRADLGASFSDLQWVIDAYALTLAATLLNLGSLADRIGRRRVFVGGLAVFTASSLACALAPSPLALNLARAVQGVGAAGIFATSLALLAAEFSPERRGMALGIWGAVSGAALALGPVLGGAIVDGPGWEWIFLINLPLGVLLIALAARLGESRNRVAGRTDWRGLLTFSGGLFLIVLGLIRGNGEGWSSTPILASLVGGSLLLVTFALVELRATPPMLNVRMLRNRSFSGTAAVAFTQSVALYPLLLFTALYFQEILHLTPFETGLRLLPITVALFLVAPLSGRLTAVVPLGLLMAAGLACVGTGLLLMHGLEVGDDWDTMLPAFLVGGAGVGLISPALADAMVKVLPSHQVGTASGISNTFRQVGIAAGIAGLGAIFQGRVGTTFTEATPTAFVDGINEVVLVAALVALAGALAALLLIRTEAFAA